MARFGAEEGRLADAVAAVPTEPWLRAVGLAVTAGTLSAAAADAIRTELGSPSDSMPASTLATTAEHLCVEATTPDVDRLTFLARQLRDQIDETGIADRENQRHAARSLRVVKQADGMTRLVWMMDPETAATISTHAAPSNNAADTDSSAARTTRSTLRPWNGWPVPDTPRRSYSTVPGHPWTSAGNTGYTPNSDAPHWPSGTADACSPTATDQHPGANATTSASGPGTTAEPIWPMESSSADTTTSSSSSSSSSSSTTTTAGRSNATTSTTG